MSDLNVFCGCAIFVLVGAVIWRGINLLADDFERRHPDWRKHEDFVP